MALTANIPLQVLLCGDCGCTFAVPGALFLQTVESQGWLFCPNGHAQRFVVELPHERRIRELEARLARSGADLMRSEGEVDRLRATLVERLIDAPNEGGPST